MPEYSSGSIRFSGLGYNDTNFDDTIDKLYKIETKQINKLAQWKADWQTRQDAFKQVREELTNLRTALAAINTVDKFLVKATESSQSGVATAILGSGAEEGSYRIEVGQTATNAIWSASTGITDRAASINTNSANGIFSYTYKGEERTVEVPRGTTLDGFVNLINQDSKNRGVKASLVKSSGGYVFQLRGEDSGAEASLSINGVSGISGMNVSAWSSSSLNVTTVNREYASGGDVINSSGAPQTFSYSIRGAKGGYNTYSVTLDDGATLDDLVAAVNADAKSGHATAELVATAGGGVQFRLTTGDLASHKDDHISISDNASLDGFANLAGSEWRQQENVNAKIRVNGWPGGPEWLEVSSNAVDDVVQGMTFNLKETGSSVITVGIDTEAVTENVEAFVGALNSARVAIDGLTKYDSTKKTVESKYAESQFEMQKGSVLTGNYGVQLVDSRLKSAVASKAIGFSYLDEKTLLGDTFSSLAQVGILTNGEENSPNFGLLEINNEPNYKGSLSFAQALAKDPMAVAELFAAVGTGETSSPNFSFQSQVTGVTRPGSYNVAYTVDADGNIVSATVNGKDAKINNETGELIVLRAQPSSTQSGAVSAAFTDGDGVNSSHTVEVNQVATKAGVTLNTGLTDVKASVNTSGQPQSISILNAEGKNVNIEVAPDVTLEGLVGNINKNSRDLGVAASLVAMDDDADPDTPVVYALKLESMTTGEGSITLEATALSGNFVNPETTTDIATGFTSLTDSINTTGNSTLITVTGADGSMRGYVVPPGSSLQDLVTQINGSGDEVKAAVLGDEKKGYTLRLIGPQSGAGTIRVGGTAGLAGISPTWKGSNYFDAPSSSANTSSETQNFAITAADGTVTSLAVTPGESLQSLIDRINGTAGAGVRAEAVETVDPAYPDEPKYILRLVSTQGESGTVSVSSGELSGKSNGSWTSSSVEGQDARYSIDGGAEVTSRSNTVTSAKGLNITLKGVTNGPATITSQANNDADGIIIRLDNRAEGSFTGKVSIKQGKVNELLEMLNGTPQHPEEGMLGSKGALRILEDNYQGIMDGITEKMNKEEERLVKWERTTRARFARLDMVLSQYSNLESSIQSQIKQLGSSSGK